LRQKNCHFSFESFYRHYQDEASVFMSSSNQVQ